MRNWSLLGAIAACLLSVQPLPAQTPPAASTPPRSTRSLADHDEVASALRLLEAWIESHLEYRQLPGLSIAIVHDQDVVWARGFGYADVAKQVPATPETVYRIASISKVFTAIAVMQLRDQGKLQLDDPVARHLPWFKIKSSQAASPITIRHLLTHTSGLPRESPYPYFTDFKFPTREEMIKALASQEAVYPPETEWKYSNLGLALAGEVVSAVSGEEFDAYVQRHILAPLGMKSSSVGVTDVNRGRLAVGYGRRIDGKREIRPFTDAKGLAPAAAVSSTVLDLARLASLQFRADSPELRGATLREMHRVHWLMPDWKSGRGLGFHIVHREDGDLVGHGGWVAGYQSAFYFRPQDRVAVIAMINADDGLPYPGHPDSVVDRAFKWVGPAIRRATTPSVDPAPRPEWQKYVGRYRNAWADSQVLILRGKLVLINPTEADPSGGQVTLEPLAQAHTFRMVGGSPSGPHGERLVFELGQDGKVNRIKIGENYSWPLK